MHSLSESNIMVEKIFSTFVQIFRTWAEHGNFKFFTAKLLYLALNQVHNSLILLFCIAQPDLSDAWFLVLDYLQKQHSLLRFLPFLYSVNQFAHFVYRLVSIWFYCPCFWLTTLWLLLQSSYSRHLSAISVTCDP